MLVEACKVIISPVFAKGARLGWWESRGGWGESQEGGVPGREPLLHGLLIYIITFNSLLSYTYEYIEESLF